MWGLVRSHDCPHQYIHMHPCTLKREKLGIFRSPSSCLCVLSLSDGAQCLFLCLPLGSVLFLYPAAGSLISHQRGYTGGSVRARQIAIDCVEAASPLSPSLCGLTPLGDFLRFVSPSNKEPQHRDKDLIILCAMKEPAQHT